ncbi:hypothetical protein GG344DRAFT_66171 [Lentinula edodes]|nr:hypothetical protein GG344DRAFT_66171 [Lentinula edodes]
MRLPVPRNGKALENLPHLSGDINVESGTLVYIFLEATRSAFDFASCRTIKYRETEGFSGVMEEDTEDSLVKFSIFQDSQLWNVQLEQIGERHILIRRNTPRRVFCWIGCIILTGLQILSHSLHEHCWTRAISNMIRPSTHTLKPSISVDGGEDYSRMTLSPSSYSDSLSFSLLSLIPDFIDLPLIRVPLPLILPETPLRERRGFEAFITITPRADVHGKTSAKGQLEPTAGGLPRRRRIVKSINVKGSVINHASDFDSDSDSYDSEDDM